MDFLCAFLARRGNVGRSRPPGAVIEFLCFEAEDPVSPADVLQVVGVRDDLRRHGIATSFMDIVRDTADVPGAERPVEGLMSRRRRQ